MFLQNRKLKQKGFYHQVPNDYFKSLLFLHCSNIIKVHRTNFTSRATVNAFKNLHFNHQKAKELEYLNIEVPMSLP